MCLHLPYWTCVMLSCLQLKTSPAMTAEAHKPVFHWWAILDFAIRPPCESFRSTLLTSQYSPKWMLRELGSVFEWSPSLAMLLASSPRQAWCFPETRKANRLAGRRCFLSQSVNWPSAQRLAPPGSAGLHSSSYRISLSGSVWLCLTVLILSASGRSWLPSCSETLCEHCLLSIVSQWELTEWIKSSSGD